MDKGTIIEGETVRTSEMNLQTVLQIPAVRQVSILLGVAAAVAAGVAIVLWSQKPSYTSLYSQLDGADAAQVVEALRAANIDYELNAQTGTVMVPESRLHAARLELAAQGLPQDAAAGMDSLREQPTFGQSQFRETALYQHALESELARTISVIGAVREARVHLALPRHSGFIRDRKTASASVMLNLYRGQELADDQTASIVNLVASSVPDLAANNVTVIDQHGRLLSSGEESWSDRITATQFKFAERVERNYKRRIEDLLTPLVGPGRVRAEVVADLDFTVSEETRESFDPANTAVVSESISENESVDGALEPGGVPGALSNQPPEAGGSAAEATAVAANRSSSSATRNFEVDRTISHTRPQLGTIRRLSVAVLIDDRPAGADAAGAADAAAADSALSEADIERYTALIKEAVGFDEARGDTVAVVGAAFQPLPEAPAAEPLGLLENPVVTDSLRQILGAVLALALAFGLVRPMLKSLLAGGGGGARAAGGSSAVAMAGASIGPGGAAIGAPTFDEKIAAAKNISAHDPAKVAHVVKKWVESDAA
ncbi:MAG: flagellar basal-body MS-ring/collar protein FliF [Woeseiaceae bacterium]|nr:flagellar basal-body MS-ring/collar protein FliF [Woeseiaceae bacterium]